MAYLTETPTFDASVYRLDATDPLLGYYDGNNNELNQAAQALTNRTAYLKAHQDTVAAQLTLADAAALRAVDVTAGFGVAMILGATVSGDGGGGSWRWDAESTATDNLGTVICPTGRTAAGRWLRQFEGAVNLRWFGATGVAGHDATDALIAAAAYIDATDKTLFIPNGQYLISEQIVFVKPPNIIGESYSPPVWGTFPLVGGTPYAAKGTLLISAVADDYAVVINPPANNVYIRGLNLENLHLLAATGNTTGGGFAIHNCGWGGYCKNLVVENFRSHGLKLSQVQDTQFDSLQVIHCGTDNVSPGLWITGGSNFLGFNNPQLELNEWHLQIDNSFAIEFFGAHIEQGDYPTPPTGGNVIPRYPSVRLIGVANHVKFVACYFAAPTLASTMAKYSISADECPYYIFCDTNIDATFTDCSILCGYGSGKLIQFNGDGYINHCMFNRGCVETYSINLSGNVIFTGNNVAFHDDGSSAAMYGMIVNYATVRGNFIAAQNASALAKTSGAIFSSNGTGRIGQNQLLINKYNLIFSGAPIQVEYNPSGIVHQPFTGVIDAQAINPDLIWAPTASGTLDDIQNWMGNQQIRIMNTSDGTFTVSHSATTGGHLAMKGAVAADIPPGGMLQLQANPIAGTLSELFRSF